ncbi:hypothetical protein [Nostoc sp. MS1]|nr:hypothetical protein [Nostoc sp. MS1]
MWFSFPPGRYANVEKGYEGVSTSLNSRTVEIQLPRSREVTHP